MLCVPTQERGNESLKAGLGKLAVLCLALSCAFGSTAAVAQDQDEDARQEETAAAESNEQGDEQKQAEAEEKKSSASVGGSSPDTFVPSEGISEDLSVSFPVDI